MMHDDEDWDPTRVRAAKIRAIQRKADRKRRKIKTETELARRQADPQIRERYIRMKYHARDTDMAKRAKLLNRKDYTGGKTHKERLSIF